VLDILAQAPTEAFGRESVLALTAGVIEIVNCLTRTPNPRSYHCELRDFLGRREYEADFDTVTFGDPDEVTTAVGLQHGTYWLSDVWYNPALRVLEAPNLAVRLFEEGKISKFFGYCHSFPGPLYGP
jgi:hypothetical protein